MNSAPTEQQILAASNEGAQAAAEGLEFRTHCPYTYDCFPGMSYGDFNDFKRPLLNAWFAAWQASRQRRGLP